MICMKKIFLFLLLFIPAVLAEIRIDPLSEISNSSGTVGYFAINTTAFM